MDGRDKEIVARMDTVANGSTKPDSEYVYVADLKGNGRNFSTYMYLREPVSSVGVVKSIRV